MVEWLPVDASIMIDEDFTASPNKNAAVADANKSLNNSNSATAIEKLKLSGVKIKYRRAGFAVERHHHQGPAGRQYDQQQQVIIKQLN